MKQVSIGHVSAGNLSVSVVSPEPGQRGTARVELYVYGARYPYKLSADEARTLGRLLEDGAEKLGVVLPASAAHTT